MDHPQVPFSSFMFQQNGKLSRIGMIHLRGVISGLVYKRNTQVVGVVMHKTRHGFVRGVEGERAR